MHNQQSTPSAKFKKQPCVVAAAKSITSTYRDSNNWIWLISGSGSINAKALALFLCENDHRPFVSNPAAL